MAVTLLPPPLVDHCLRLLLSEMIQFIHTWLCSLLAIAGTTGVTCVTHTRHTYTSNYVRIPSGTGCARGATLLICRFQGRGLSLQLSIRLARDRQGLGYGKGPRGQRETCDALQHRSTYKGSYLMPESNKKANTPMHMQQDGTGVQITLLRKVSMHQQWRGKTHATSQL